ncbi:hypothetical protein GVAV_003553 [Gurleya vavrai]
MFTPENIKKLTNVSIITYKKNNKKFELALYPNKLIEYRNNNSIPLIQILHTFTIFKDVSKGEVSNKNDLKECFKNLRNEDIIYEILQFGNERVSEKTRDYLNDKRETEFVSIVMEKVTEDGRFMNPERIKKLMKLKSFKIDAKKDVKVQANEFIKNLCEDHTFKKVAMRIEVFNDELNEKYKIFFEKDKKIIYVDGEDFFGLKNYCKDNKFRYVILQNEEIEEEEIC